MTSTIVRLPAAALVATLAMSAAARAESVVIDAFSLWTAEGSVLQTGPDQTVFAGAMRGPYIVDAGQGPMPAGEIACIGTIMAETSSGRQHGAAQCRVTADDGAVGFARFSCEGLRLVGCAGSFEFTGGEGRLAGIGGGGRIVIRRTEAELSIADGVIRETGFGIASWEDLTITMPDAQ
ncbi:hypothetical protein M1105_04050 [Limibaculum sp. FT325]|uniref:hypothetical protein n=1 Tax=Thermohalobaculum sediminis TaxID=2939436 RepID=UPI0020C172D7|nr:hypothetical protein [Limibaculum sediminis]MCL5776161.1 hypothetical protein [Limibaculum sediminis]